ncbi:bifunctional lytic transglycosylase/amino acid ABC transporter substrate-binding protein, partial [Pseudomonas aeruginosa]
LPPLAYDTLYRLPLKLIVSRRTPDAEQLRQRLDQAFEQLSAKGEKVELN